MSQPIILPPTSVLIRQARERAGLTRYAASKQSGITQRAWSALEKGADPKLSTLRAVAGALGVDPRDLVGSPEIPKNP